LHEDAVPKTTVIFYRESDGTVPALQWLEELPPRAIVKVRVKLDRLKEMGHELRRPESDFLRDGIHELRIRLQRVNYRVLYFFHGNVAAVVSHVIIKERTVPPEEIDRAVKRKEAFAKNPALHSFGEG
jgi:phage-related protein